MFLASRLLIGSFNPKNSIAQNFQTGSYLLWVKSRIQQPGAYELYWVMKTVIRVLNLEDCPEDAELNEAMISARWPQCEYVRVDNQTDFLAALEQKNFDVILSDYTMPGFDGQSALALAHGKCPEIPFLFVSGTIGEDAAIEALKSGATDYFLKHRLMRLIPAVDRALREAADHAEREHAEKAMRESEHKYREVFESLGEAAFLADEKTGKIIDTNRCAEKMLHCGRSEILGQKQSQLLTLSGENKLAETATFTCRLNCADGATRQVRAHISRLKIHGHPLVLWLCHEMTMD
jgi:PAS domain S-box-containing protein